MKLFGVLAVSLLALGVPASAAVVYSNNFDAEGGGSTQLNYNSFSGLTVTDGTVDLVANGDYGIACKTGSCVDLDGSTGNAGILASTASYGFSVGDLVTLSFAVSGNQRGGASDDWKAQFTFAGLVGFSNYGYSLNGAPVNLGPVGATSLYSLTNPNVAPNSPYVDVTVYFTAATAGSLTFLLQTSGGDDVGPIVDNLALDVSAVPEPATWAMMIGGFALAGAAMRRKKAVVSFS